jgi:glycosyltransferase involved in cell wall biosynthesis
VPARARAAPPTLANAVELAPAPVVVVLRSYLVPLGITLANRLGASRIVVDLDDDDVGLLRARGDDAEADAYERLLSAWLLSADLVLAAAPDEAAALAARHPSATVATLPNAVRPPARVTEPPGHARLLFVGNLTYAPNVVAARVLVDEVLPAVRAAVPEVTVDVVGPHDEGLAALAGRDGVRLAGRVPEVTPWYDRADVVVVPLLEGAGTRIKVLEAFAHGRPVVATPAAVAGLPVRDGGSVLLGVDATTLARQTIALLQDPARARAVAAEASALVHGHYVLDVVAPAARRLIFGAS